MKRIAILAAALAFSGCGTSPLPDSSGLVGMTQEQAIDALRARGLGNVSRVRPPAESRKPSYLYAEHRDLVGWPCPPRQWIAVHFDAEGGRATRVDRGVATDCAWP